MASRNIGCDCPGRTARLPLAALLLTGESTSLRARPRPDAELGRMTRVWIIHLLRGGGDGPGDLAVFRGLDPIGEHSRRPRPPPPGPRGCPPPAP